MNSPPLLPDVDLSDQHILDINENGEDRDVSMAQSDDASSIQIETLGHECDGTDGCSERRRQGSGDSNSIGTLDDQETSCLTGELDASENEDSGGESNEDVDSPTTAIGCRPEVLGDVEPDVYCFIKSCMVSECIDGQCVHYVEYNCAPAPPCHIAECQIGTGCVFTAEPNCW